MSWTFLAPSILGVAVFFVLPFITVVQYSLVDNPISNTYVGFENYKNLLKNPAFLMAAKNTLTFSVVAVALAVLLSLGLALMLEAKIPAKSRLRTFFLSPLVVPTASVILIWQVVFSYNGSFNSIVELFGGQPIDWLKSEYSQIVILLMFLWKNLGYNMILFMAALSNIPKAQLEAAEVDGAGAVRRFFVIKLRYISPSLFFVILLSLINSFKIFREVYLLTGGYPYESIYFLQHFMNNTFKSLDYQKLSAAAIIMSVVILVVILVIFLLEDRLGKDVEE
ncbi:MAG: sugar ABC transporter permease [Clostridia bacterium]|nr:sugar ABC transporter permease [Clostridia bacterium]